MKHAILLLVKVDHAHRVRNADDPALDVVHTLLLRQLRKVDGVACGNDETDGLVGHHAHGVAEAESVGSVFVGLELELVIALALCVVHLLVVRVEDGDIHVHVGSALEDGVGSVDGCALMHILVKALGFARWKVKGDGVPKAWQRYHEQRRRAQRQLREPHRALLR